MTAPHCARASGNFSLGPEDVFALGDSSICVHAAEDRTATADLPVIDNDKAAEIRNAVVIVDNERTARLNCKSANLVSIQLFARIIVCIQRRTV